MLIQLHFTTAPTDISIRPTRTISQPKTTTATETTKRPRGRPFKDLTKTRNNVTIPPANN